ncbi:DNA cytosine methyltransferase [Streptomyces leeuwenhoekii]|uniref:DNA (cytosine-5-)-methyltransferase n=1 Tax=Streptomyces leeuwenhoekii TaxID=1437453 RepID=A0A0F7VKZ3_STRLW|nr:DNA cytosine methyltransferase [Streptomyces leeuwenhoekii]CQR59195.1 sle1_028 [Streptomyces leeuwenhoekii]
MADPTEIVDLFRGPGGWSEGLRMLGLADIGLEWDSAAARTAHAAGHLGIQCDVAQYPTRPFAGRIKGKISSPPCQPWSRAGKRAGLVDQALVQQAVHDLAHGRDTRTELRAACKDDKSLLAAEPMRWICDLRPEWICMEQVPDVLPLWKQYTLYLQQWGYSTWAGILNAADYGVPQTRKRAILIASRVRSVTAPAPTHAKAPELDLFGECLQPWVSMAEALGWTAGLTVNTRGERKTPGGNEFPADQPSWALTEKTRSWVLHTNRDQRADGSRQTADPYAGPAPTFTVKSGGQWVLRNGNQPNAAIRTVDEPARTMAFGNNSARIEWVQQRPATTVCATDRISPPGHRNRDAGGESQFASPDTVRITVAEAAVLQSFRPDYPFQGTKTAKFTQIGNAVPPLLAAAVVGAATGLDWQAAVQGEEERRVA